uniref:Uncharacterized protein n=1 Tax=Lepeophtheirus salmonis TaxID=72036 RepID=A0A0K2ULP2_LEPSM
MLVEEMPKDTFISWYVT